MKVSVIGAGYVGLVTGACLAERGHRVVCVDVDRDKVDRINRGDPPIYEQGLSELMARNVPARLSASSDLRQAVIGTDVTLIAVGTPFDGRRIDLSQVQGASEEIGRALRDKAGYHLVVVKSTVVPGTTDDVVLPIIEKESGKKADREFGLGMNPEFLTEGQAVADFMKPDRIVLGASDARSMQLLEELYASFSGTPILRTNNKTAEMIKYASNAMLATQISFANEIAKLCSALGGVDVVDVMRGVHLSYYLSPFTEDGSRLMAPVSGFLEAGCGFGGSCLPKDVKALIAHGGTAGVAMPLLTAVIDTNQNQFSQVTGLLRKHFESLEDIPVGILGLAFKPDTSDIRESPAFPIIKDLLARGAIVKAYDPVANKETRRHLAADRLEYCETLEEVLAGVRAVVLVTRWEQFRAVPDLLKKMNPGAVFVDGRRMLDKTLFRHYEGIGL